jgi:(+)-trans-carveol dehydrogenase
VGRVAGKVAFVTGVARGQGRSHAKRLAEEGADIIGLDSCRDVESVTYGMATKADLEETVRLIEGLDRRIVAREADVRDLAAVEEVVREGVAELGPVDIVCANAGIWSAGTADQLPESTWQDMIDINMTGVWHTVKAAIPHLNDGASLILTSSTAGTAGYANIVHYTAAKHGVVGIMRSLAHELAPRMIRVNSVHPTCVDTALLNHEEMYELFCPDLEDPTREQFLERAELANLLPVPVIQPEDVSNAVLFLASDEAKYITGVPLPIDAGVAAK